MEPVAGMSVMRHPVALLDTSVVIAFDPASVAQRADAAAISTIALAELSNGLHTADPLENAKREAHYRWAASHFAPLTFESSAARTYGAVRQAVLTAVGDPRPRAFDLLIASVALANELPLVTRNAIDFRGLPAALTVIAV